MSIEIPCTEVELTISARNLPDRDVLSKSDPMCVIYVKNNASNATIGDYRELARTETIQNTLNPEFVKKIRINYYFEELQKIKFEIYDVDSQSMQLSQHDFLGRFETTLGEIVSSGTLHRPLEGLNSIKSGVITISAEEVDNGNKQLLYIVCKGTNLDKKDLFGKSDPFLNIYRINADKSRQLAHRTEVIKKTLNPDWKPFEISIRQLCAGDFQRQFLIECFDYDNDGGHDFIGSCQTSVDYLMRNPQTSFPLINAKKQQKKKNYTDSGILHVVARLTTEYSFLDYIRGGTQINFSVAVDFTASNGHPNEPQSLHYINPYQPNSYQLAIQSVGEICQEYNASKQFAAFGFGAKLSPTAPVSHLFHLNFNPMDPRCENGVAGILHAYMNAIRQCILYGPTNFSPTIEQVARIAASIVDGSQYHILLIITDGIITDMVKTKEAIIAASQLPMSIIIIGVGNDEFTAMDELDSDNVRLSVNGRYAERDIVQFVPLRNFLSATTSPNSWAMSQARLAKEVLAEVPAQLTGWMKMRNISPRPPPPTSTIYPTQPTAAAAPNVPYQQQLKEGLPASYPMMGYGQNPVGYTPAPMVMTGYQQNAMGYQQIPVQNPHNYPQNPIPYPQHPAGYPASSEYAIRSQISSPPPPYDDLYNRSQKM